MSGSQSDQNYTREELFLKSLPTQRRIWNQTALSGYMRCPRFYYYSEGEEWRGQGSVDLDFGKLMGDAADAYNKALLNGASSEHATELAVEYALAATWPKDGDPWGGYYAQVWRCDGKVKGAKGRPVKCPNSKQWNPWPAGVMYNTEELPPEDQEGETLGCCRSCGDEVSPETIYFPHDKVKNRHTLIRAVVAYCDAMAASNIRPIRLPDGRIGSELSFLHALPLTSADGTSYLLTGAWDQVAEVGESELIIPEMKTTRKDPGQAYLNQFEPGCQLYLYSWAGEKEFPGRRPKVWKLIIHLGIGFANVYLHPIRVPPSLLEEFEQDMIYWITRAEDDAIVARSLVEQGKDPKEAYRRNVTACHSMPGAQNTPCPFRGICRLAPEDRGRFLENNFTRVPHNPTDVKGT